MTEKSQIEERRGEVAEKFGPLPAIAIGYTHPPKEARKIGTLPGLWIASCTAAAPAASIAGWCWKSRLPLKRTATQKSRDKRSDADGDAHFSQARITRRADHGAFDEVIIELHAEKKCKRKSIP